MQQREQLATCNVSEISDVKRIYQRISPPPLSINSSVRFLCYVQSERSSSPIILECVSYGDSMIAVKYRGSNFLKMQLKMSDKSLQSFRSDSSFSCSSAKADATSVKERGQMYASQSPSLRKLSTASFSVDTQSMQRAESPLRSITPFPASPDS